MKIKIVEPGNESYTGFLGDVQFFGGVSVGDVSEQSAAGISSVYQIERIDAEAAPEQEDQAQEGTEQISEQADETSVEEVTSEEQKPDETPAVTEEVTSEEQKPDAAPAQE